MLYKWIVLSLNNTRSNIEKKGIVLLIPDRKNGNKYIDSYVFQRNIKKTINITTISSNCYIEINNTKDIYSLDSSCISTLLLDFTNIYLRLNILMTPTTTSCINISSLSYFQKIKICYKILKLGFSNPILHRLSSSIVFNPDKENQYKSSNILTIRQFLDVLHTTTLQTSEMSFYIEKDSINSLKKIPLLGSCYTNIKSQTKLKNCSQKEKAGILYVSDINNENIYILKLQEKSIILGTEEGVQIIPALYNFHSHPKDAYIANNVTNAIPSAQDYIAYLHSVMKCNTKCHFVIAIEGIYIISISNYFSTKQNFETYIESQEHIYKIIRILYDEKIIGSNGIVSYIKKTKSLFYKNKRIFDVQFYRWAKLYTSKIKINYMT